jgi:hypothetical protein
MVARSEKTLETYRKSLATVKKLLDIDTDTDEYLLDYKTTIKTIEDSTYSENTKKVIYTAIKSTIRDKNDERFNAIQKFYNARMNDYANKSREKEESQTLSEKEVEKYVDWNTILDVRKKLHENLNKIDIDNDHYEFANAYQDYLIVCLYTMIEPVRLDFAPMTIVKEKPRKPTGNYLVWNSKPYFLFSEYKTSHAHGVVRRNIPNDLKQVLDSWMCLNPTDSLLIDRYGCNMKEMTLCQKIIRIFERMIQKRVGVSQIRHSYVTYMRDGEMPLKQQQEMAKNMMHSPNMSIKYRKIE